MIILKKGLEFAEWLSALTLKEQAQIEARLSRIESSGHFGDCKPLQGMGQAIYELRWKNGWRVYFYRDTRNSIYLLLGGKKNDQKKDIQRAKVLFERYADC